MYVKLGLFVESVYCTLSFPTDMSMLDVGCGDPGVVRTPCFWEDMCEDEGRETYHDVNQEPKKTPHGQF